MLEELKSEDIVRKVGGRFKLTALVQKRMFELLQGSRPLVENTENMSLLEIVVQEILQDKIAGDFSPSGRKTEIAASRRSEDAERRFDKRHF
jgi:DNA-directed RNA polymerase subunit omega